MRARACARVRVWVSGSANARTRTDRAAAEHKEMRAPEPIAQQRNTRTQKERKKQNDLSMLPPIIVDISGLLNPTIPPRRHQRLTFSHTCGDLGPPNPRNQKGTKEHPFLTHTCGDLGSRHVLAPHDVLHMAVAPKVRRKSGPQCMSECG